MGDREWIAHHEAAHAVVAFLLERRVHLVSIRPTEAYGGVVVRAHGPRGHYDESLLFRPTVLWPAKLRRELEVDIMIALAGDVGEELALGPRSGFGQPEHERQAESALRALSDLSRRERERLDHLEGATTPLEPDQEQALAAAHAMDGDAPVALLVWLRAVTRSLVYQTRSIRAIDALVTELLERDVVGGRRAHQIIAEAMKAKRPRLDVAASPPIEGSHE